MLMKKTPNEQETKWKKKMKWRRRKERKKKKQTKTKWSRQKLRAFSLSSSSSCSLFCSFCLCLAMDIAVSYAFSIFYVLSYRQFIRLFFNASFGCWRTEIRDETVGRTHDKKKAKMKSKKNGKMSFISEKKNKKDEKHHTNKSIRSIFSGSLVLVFRCVDFTAFHWQIKRQHKYI